MGDSAPVDPSYASAWPHGQDLAGFAPSGPVTSSGAYQVPPLQGESVTSGCHGRQEVVFLSEDFRRGFAYDFHTGQGVGLALLIFFFYADHVPDGLSGLFVKQLCVLYLGWRKLMPLGYFACEHVANHIGINVQRVVLPHKSLLILMGLQLS